MLAEFEAAPWLLPPRTPALPYAGLHDLRRLLGLRARTLGGQRVVTLLQFNRRFAELVQNCSALLGLRCLRLTLAFRGANASLARVLYLLQLRAGSLGRAACVNAALLRPSVLPPCTRTPTPTLARDACSLLSGEVWRREELRRRHLDP